MNILISNSKNKMKTAWRIIKTVTRSKVNINNMFLIDVADNLPNNSQIIACAFNKYFLTVAGNVIVENFKDKNNVLGNTNPLEYLTQCIQPTVSKY